MEVAGPPTSPREVSGFTVTPPALREVRTFTGQWQPAKVEGGGQLCQTLPDVEGGVPGGQCRTAGPSSFSCHQTGAAFLAGWAAAGRAQVRPGSRGCRAVKKHSRAPGAVPSGGGLPPGGLHGAAAAAKSLQSCPTLCDPIDGSPPGSIIPGILQARTLEWVAISFSNA